MKQYEYEVAIKVGLDINLSKINLLGKEGWRVISIEHGNVLLEREIKKTKTFSSTDMYKNIEEPLGEIPF